MYAAPVLILTLFTAGQDRGAGLVGIIWLTRGILNHPHAPGNMWIATWLLPAAGFLWMTAAPQPKTHRPRALWLIPAIVWGVFWYTELGQHSGIGYLTPVLATVVLLPIEPAFALGTAVAWSALAPWYPSVGMAETTRLGVALLAGTLLELTLLLVCRRSWRRT